MLLLALLLVARAGAQAGQAGAPGEVFIAEDALRAVLLEPADLFADPTSTSEIVARWPAGTVLEYAGETTDEFGRTWYTVRDPNRLQRRQDTYLAPFDRRQFRDFGYRGALLADRQSALAVSGAAVPAASASPAKPWWQPVSVLELGHSATFDGVVGISATAADPEELRQAIELLGGMAALGDFPAAPLPGELFVPALLPVVFQFDGEDWDLARPVRLLDDAVNLLGNGSFMVDRASPPLTGGPALYCWDLIDSIDPRGDPVGSVQVAPAPAPLRPGQPPPADMGPFDITVAPLGIRRLLPPAPDTTRVPVRVDPLPQRSGVLLSDNASRQAVYIQQRLGSDLARRLRGMSVVVDVVARDAPRVGAATFGIDVEATLAGNGAENFFTSFTSKPSASRYELAFEVPADTDDLTVRLLPLDRFLARDQRGSVIFQRASLRLARWNPDPPPAAVVLNRISANTFEGAELHTRARIAVTNRSVEEIQRAWLRVAAADWSAEDQEIVLSGELRPGMSPDQVTAAWGSPDADTSQASGAGVERRWEYADRYVVFFDDEVISFRRSSAAEQATTVRMCPLNAALPGTGMRP
jgi:hypothetical protein